MKPQTCMKILDINTEISQRAIDFVAVSEKRQIYKIDIDSFIKFVKDRREEINLLVKREEG